ncbi:unnamed protein product, partial [Closterium sp. NIES-65]
VNPQIGTDAYGVYVAANQFLEDFSSLLGPNIFAISKAQLTQAENATILRVVVPASPTPTNPSWTILPQKVAADGSYDHSHGGTMYFAYTGSINPPAPNETLLFPNVTAMGTFAVTDTIALGTPDAENRVEPHCAAVYTPPHVLPHAVTQRKDPCR